MEGPGRLCRGGLGRREVQTHAQTERGKQRQARLSAEVQVWAPRSSVLRPWPQVTCLPSVVPVRTGGRVDQGPEQAPCNGEAQRLRCHPCPAPSGAEEVVADPPIWARLHSTFSEFPDRSSTCAQMCLTSTLHGLLLYGEPFVLSLLCA